MLEQIQDANDIKKVEEKDYPQLAKEIRRFLLHSVSKTGGHLASNLGLVEVTMALHLVLDFPKDQLVFDVGHQAYVHKILTGRQKDFKTLRQYGGLSGFPSRKESDCDAFHSGHSSTSISTALGMATARDLKGSDETIVALLGDGALTGGMAYEALNNMVRLREEKKNLIVILNDNHMSISENVGGMSKYLNQLRIKKEYIELKDHVEKSLLQIPKIGTTITQGIRKSKNSMKQLFVPGMMFEDMGITYIGPIDGHNIPTLVETLKRAKELEEPIILHVVTQKGKGYPYALKNPSKYHGVGPFEVSTGKMKTKVTRKSNTAIFSETLIDLAKKDQRIVAITAAMPSGTGLKKFGLHFPKRFFDVGIAEEHAITFSAGLAVNGMKPVVAIYSTFLQRGYDQLIHDLAIENLSVVIGVDRSGLVGADGETHQGIFDTPFLTSIPNMTVVAPVNGKELKHMLVYALREHHGPIAIKYSRGDACMLYEDFSDNIVYGKGQVLRKGEDVAIFAVGNMLEEVEKARKILKEYHITVTIVNPRFLKPVDRELIKDVIKQHNLIVTVEEGILQGGFGMEVTSICQELDYHGKVRMIGIKDRFVEHGSIKDLRENLEINGKHIAKNVLQWMKE